MVTGSIGPIVEEKPPLPTPSSSFADVPSPRPSVAGRAWRGLRKAVRRLRAVREPEVEGGEGQEKLTESPALLRSTFVSSLLDLASPHVATASSSISTTTPLHWPGAVSTGFGGMVGMWEAKPTGRATTVAHINIMMATSAGRCQRRQRLQSSRQLVKVGR
ncbi:Os04g0347850 [Oryza sativa Japonica Group]|uniref:Os04g0347850 protein n=1 Tax=Oryza sativa subsp. japonica TaxID=39947 RepID=A0A0P0W9D0_ORYSJ|nr:Os04g0347850 [Oryza sativa Japonica Group]